MLCAYAYGAAKAFGFCPFGIDTLHASACLAHPEPSIAQVYAAIANLEDMLTVAEAAGRSEA
jgi:hypothetical protein